MHRLVPAAYATVHHRLSMGSIVVVRSLHLAVNRFSLRSFAVAMLIASYLLSGVLHRFCERDIVNPVSGAVIMMSASNEADTAGKGVATEHHCHGCFAVSIPAPIKVAALMEPTAAVLPSLRAHESGHTVSLDTPPPKRLS